MSAEEKPFNDGLSYSILGTVTPADDTDAGYQSTMRAFIPDTTGTVTVALESGGTTYPIPVVAGGIYAVHHIYSFDATDTDSTAILILG